MLLFRRPNSTVIRKFLDEQRMLNFSYSAVGATATNPPKDFVVDHTRIKLGEGEQVFNAAQTALSRWEHFHLGWVEAWFPETVIKPDEVVAILAHCVGCWWLNACRIVYVVNEEGTIRKFGFAYGTLPDHAEMGEERFQVEWNMNTGEVSYDILAFSRPHHILSRLGYPLVRRMQKRFARDSATAMLRAINPVC